MQLIKKIAAIFILSIALASCFPGEIPVPAADRGNALINSVDMNNDYRNQIYFSLFDNKIVSTNLKTDWDIGFQNSATGFHIVLNTGKSMTAYNTGVSDFATVTDTTGVALKSIYDVPSGNLDSTAIGNWQTTKPVYILDRGYDNLGKNTGYRKFQILEVSASHFKIKFAEVNGTGEQIITIPKDETKNFTMFSFTTNSIVNIEPPKENYDLLFTQYTHLYHDPFIPYLVSGALINPYNVKVSQVFDKKFNDIELKDTVGHDFHSNVNIIGFDWKYYNLQAGTYIVYDTKCYIIQDVKGYFYKLHFIDFYSASGIKGVPKFEFRKL